MAAVVLYHGQVPWLPDGFLGVDVFFVLSGYLITSLLLAEYRRLHTVDLRRFWLARARRLLPAAVTVIAVCLIVVAIFYRPDLGVLRGDALASLLYVNNWHQILEHRSYFAGFARPSLLEHYWSLAVEEQFYLVWPVLLIGALRRVSVRWVVAGTGLLLAGSTVLMAVLYRGADPTRVYYGTDTRAAPLMIGALLAFAWPLGRMAESIRSRARIIIDCLGVAALVALVALMVIWHSYDPLLYHGGFAIAGALAAILIAVVSHPASWLGKAFSVRALRWIGQRSYGIYLWHWPVMALTRPRIDLHWSSWILLPMQIALTVGLAAASYRYVEMPVRRGTAWRSLRRWLDDRRPRVRLATVLSTAGAGAAVVALLWTLPLPAPSGVRPALASAAARVPARRLAESGRGGRLPPPSAAILRRGDGRVLAVGASVMLAAQSALQHQLGARVDCAVGRQPSAILNRLQAYRAAGALPSEVVVQIGDNGPLWRADVRRLRSVLRGVQHVVLVNIREPTASWQDEVNSALEQTVRSWPEARIADWFSASADPSLLYDGAHPDPAGQRVYASVIARTLAGELPRAVKKSR